MLTTKWQPTTRVDCERILICKGLPYWHLAVDTARKRVFESLQTAGGGRQNVNQPAPLVLRLATTTTTTTACLLPLQAGSPTDFWSTETRLCAGRWLPLLTQTWNDRRALQSIIISFDLRKRKKNDVSRTWVAGAREIIWTFRGFKPRNNGKNRLLVTDVPGGSSRLWEIVPFLKRNLWNMPRILEESPEIHKHVNRLDSETRGFWTNFGRLCPESVKLPFAWCSTWRFLQAPTSHFSHKLNEPLRSLGRWDSLVIYGLTTGFQPQRDHTFSESGFRTTTFVDYRFIYSGWEPVVRPRDLHGIFDTTWYIEEVILNYNASIIWLNLHSFCISILVSRVTPKFRHISFSIGWV